MQGRLEIAAGGGADRRSAKIADRPLINRAKRSLRPGRSTPPRGASRPQKPRLTGPPRGNNQREQPFGPARGTRVARVGISVEIRVGISVGVEGLGPRWGWTGPAGLRSLPAKQHAPKARPSPATDCGRQAVVPGRPSSTNGYAVGPARRRGAGHSPLTAGHRAPAGTTSLPASLVASKPGGGISPRTPLLPSTASGQDVTNRWRRLAGDMRTDRNSNPSRPGEQRGGRIVTGRWICLFCCYDPRR
jgi:hypothetical protein